MLKPCALLSIGALAFVAPAQAVVVASAASNTTAPTGQPYFNNVGIVGGGSAVYLGDGWVLTAAHVAGSLPSSASFGGSSYSTVAGSFHRLANASPLSATTDLVLFQISSPPMLPSVPICTTSGTVGTDLMMIGAGRTQLTTETNWNVTVVAGPNNDIWTEVTPPPPADATGYKTTATRTMKWGENEIDSFTTINYGAGDVVGFLTSFSDDASAFTHEAQAQVGDSGGAVFGWTGSSWELSGIMLAVATFDNQPANTAVYGNQTFSADLCVYSSQILSIIPEPSAAPLGLLGFIPFFTRRRA